MPNNVTKGDSTGKRVTVLFSLRDWVRILAEQKRSARELGYKVTISDVIRAVVSEALER